MSSDGRLDELLDCWEEALDRGQPLTPEQLCATCPELLPAFREQLARLKAVAWVNRPPTASQQQQPLPLQSGSEPIPGHRLVRKLGQGGAGEVWQAVRADGVAVALKFLPLEHRLTQSEIRALQLVGDLHHPALLPLQGWWETPGHFLLSMELAEGTLADRLRECQAQGLRGIPLPELLDYLDAVAAGLDFLNQGNQERGQPPIQHRDVKPANILLVGGRAKLGDFGLARLMQHSVISHSGHMTLVFAAPEFLQGRTSSHSDQYSLAVTYCWLRTGQLPFTGTPAQMLVGHLQGTPNLTGLSSAEAEILARALQKAPEQRWSSCVEFAATLRSAALAASESTLTQPTAMPKQVKRDHAPRGVLPRICLSLVVLTILGLLVAVGGGFLAFLDSASWKARAKAGTGGPNGVAKPLSGNPPTTTLKGATNSHLIQKAKNLIETEQAVIIRVMHPTVTLDELNLTQETSGFDGFELTYEFHHTGLFTRVKGKSSLRCSFDHEGKCSRCLPVKWDGQEPFVASKALIGWLADLIPDENIRLNRVFQRLVKNADVAGVLVWYLRHKG